MTLQLSARAANIAGKCITLTNDRIDLHRKAQSLGDRGCGLQRACIGGGNDACDTVAAQRLTSGAGLIVAQQRQLWVDDARVAPRLAEDHIEFALAVSQQDHEGI